MKARSVSSLKRRRIKKKFGDAGYRSRYLPHAKRALYHLSYTPVINIASQDYIILIDMKIVV